MRDWKTAEIRELIDRIEELTGDTPKIPRHAVKRGNQYVVEWLGHRLRDARLPRFRYLDWIRDDYGDMRPPEEVDEEGLRDALFGACLDLAFLGVELTHTDHLSDRQLYVWLWEAVNEVHVDWRQQLGVANMVELWDPACDTVDGTEAWLAYYATDEEREAWSQGWDGELPRRQTPLYERAPILSELYRRIRELIPGQGVKTRREAEWVDPDLSRRFADY